MNLLYACSLFLLPGTFIFNMLYPAHPLSLLCTCRKPLNPASLTLSPQRQWCSSPLFRTQPCKGELVEINAILFHNWTSCIFSLILLKLRMILPQWHPDARDCKTNAFVSVTVFYSHWFVPTRKWTDRKLTYLEILFVCPNILRSVRLLQQLQLYIDWQQYI